MLLLILYAKGELYPEPNPIKARKYIVPEKKTFKDKDDLREFIWNTNCELYNMAELLEKDDDDEDDNNVVVKWILRDRWRFDEQVKHCYDSKTMYYMVLRKL